MEPVEQYSRGPSKLATIKSYLSYIAVGILFAVVLAAVFVMNEVLLYFTPKMQKDGTLYFVVMGDYGRNGGNNQSEVAAAMASWCAKKTASGKCDFIVGTGDNFYPNGVSKLFDSQFTTSYENIYNYTSLANTRFSQALGNHDYRGYIEAQLAYARYHASLTTRTTPQFYLPSRYYDYVMQQAGLRIHFVVADTSVLTKQYESSSSMNQTELKSQDPAAQLKFINETLAKYPYKKTGVIDANAVDFKFLVGHHPVFGGADDAERITNSQLPMQKVLKPLIDAHKVTAYLAGHNHNLEYLKASDSNSAYIISGAGSKSELPIKTPEQIKFMGQSGFVFCVARPTGVKVSFVNLFAQEVETFTLPRA